MLDKILDQKAKLWLAQQALFQWKGRFQSMILRNSRFKLRCHASRTPVFQKSSINQRFLKSIWSMKFPNMNNQSCRMLNTKSRFLRRQSSYQKSLIWVSICQRQVWTCNCLRNLMLRWLCLNPMLRSICLRRRLKFHRLQKLRWLHHQKLRCKFQTWKHQSLSKKLTLNNHKLKCQWFQKSKYQKRKLIEAQARRAIISLHPHLQCKTMVTLMTEKTCSFTSVKMWMWQSWSSSIVKSMRISKSPYYGSMTLEKTKLIQFSRELINIRVFKVKLTSLLRRGLWIHWLII